MLSHSPESFRILEVLPYPALAVDRGGRIVWFNRPSADLFGPSLEIGEPFLTCLVDASPTLTDGTPENPILCRVNPSRPTAVVLNAVPFEDILLWRAEPAEGDDAGLLSLVAETILLLSPEGKCLRAVPTAASDLRASPLSVSGKSILDLYPTNAPDTVLAALRQVSSQGDAVDIEFSVMVGNRLRWIAASIARHNDELVWASHDITERKYIEEMLLQRQREVMTLLNGLPTFAFVKDIRSRYVLVNEEFCRALRLSRDQIIGKSDIDLYPPDIGQSYVAEDDRILQGEVDLLVTERTRTSGNRRVTVNTRKVPLRNEQGKVIGLIGVSFDISDLKEAQEALRLSETRYRSIIENHLELIIRHLPEGDITFGNDAFCRFFGLDRNILQQTSLLSLMVADFHPTYFDQLARLSPSTPFSTYEIQMVRADSQLRWLQMSTLAIYNDLGEMVECQSVSRDITEARFAAEKLNLRLEIDALITRLSTHFVNVEVDEIDAAIQNALQEMGVFAGAERAYLVMFDDSAAHMTITHLWSRQEQVEPIRFLQGFPVADMTWLVDALARHEPIQTTVEDDEPSQPLLALLKAGSFAAVDLVSEKKLAGFLAVDSFETGKHWPDEIIQLLKIVGEIFASALERQRVDAVLRQQDLRNRALLSAVPDLILRIHRNGEILDCKQSQDSIDATLLVVYPGVRLKDIFPKEVEDQFRFFIEKALSSGHMEEFQYRLNSESGLKAFEGRICVSGFDEVIVFVRDVTERVRLEQMKSDFINSATHELRTPITTCLLMIDLVQEGGSQEEIGEYIQILKNEITRQKDLVEDLLMVGKLEAGVFNLNPVEIDLEKLILDCVVGISPLAQAKGIHVDVRKPAYLPEVRNDARALHQVLTNLLSNAVKFTPSGGEVTLALSRDRDRLIIQVIDTGIGIPPEDIPHLFDRFFRATNAIRKEINGSGVGLFIVKSLVERMDGHIRVESKIDRGTTFELSLPLML